MTLCHIRMMRIFKRSKESVSGQKRLQAFLILSQSREKRRLMALCFVCNPRQHRKILLRLFIFYPPSICSDMSHSLFVMS